MTKISDKVISQIRNNMVSASKRKIVSLADFLLPQDVKTADQLISMGYDPVHAAYISAQNFLSYFAEMISVFPALEEFWEVGDFAITEYMPSGLPLSPLTQSYFSGWLYLDVFFGPYRETIGTCLIDTYNALSKDSSHMIEIVRTMQASRMGLYEHCGLTDKYVILRELASEREEVCLVPAGYRGKKGQLWFVRVLPSFLEKHPYSIVFTTPYIIKNPGKTEWLEYFSRLLPMTDTRSTALSLFMKYGLTRFYWPEYIFNAYCGGQNDAIYLKGLPQQTNSFKNSKINPAYDL